MSGQHAEIVWGISKPEVLDHSARQRTALREIAHTLVNALAIDSGLICDGAKASCAAKIATAVENGLLGFNLFRSGNQFFGGDGIVKKGVERTIESIARLANDGMKETDKEIIRIMTGC
jgi:L-cysteine desulfidase